MIIVKPKSSAHWYTAGGESCHTTIGANGMERATTLRDARKTNLLPSVTSVLNVLSRPGLEAWKQEQAILAALTLPRLDGEGDDAFATRVVADMQAQVETAAGFGTAIHAAIEEVNTAGHMDNVPPEIRPWMQLYSQWKNQNIIRIHSSEAVVVHPLGYAGRYDLLAQHSEYGECLIDYKTQNVKNGKPKFYEAWAYQLAAYRYALNTSCECISVVIDSNSPSEPVQKLWTAEEIDTGLAIFKASLKIWQSQRGYIPSV